MVHLNCEGFEQFISLSQVLVDSGGMGVMYCGLLYILNIPKFNAFNIKPDNVSQMICTGKAITLSVNDIHLGNAIATTVSNSQQIDGSVSLHIW